MTYNRFNRYVCGSLLSLFTAISYADSPFTIDEIIVSVPLHKTDAQTALPITIISADELSQVAAKTLGETLKDTAGIANASFGPGVGQPVIRGQQGARVMLLSNGTQSADVSALSADHAVSVEPLLADSIEILRGPSTLLYGGGAIGGVINVIDNRIPQSLPDGAKQAFKIGYSSASQQFNTLAKIDGAIENFAYHLNANYRNSDDLEIPKFANAIENTGSGIIKNSDSQFDSFTVGSSYIYNQGFVGIAYNQQQDNYGIPLIEADGEEIRIDSKQQRLDIKGAYNTADAFIKSAKFFVTISDYQHFEIEGEGEIGTQFDNDGWQSRIEFIHKKVNNLHGAFGLQLSEFDFSAIGEESFVPPSSIGNVGVFIIEDYHLDKAIIEFGLRYDRESIDSIDFDNDFDYSSFSLSASSLWSFNNNWSLGLALSSSERAPAVQEVLSNATNDPSDLVVHAATGVIERGDLLLGTERSNNIDVTLNFNNDYFDGFITWFYNDFQDYIYLQNSGESQEDVAIFNYEQTDTQFVGIEYELSTELSQYLPDNKGQLLLSIFGDNIDGDLTDNGAVPRLPPFRIGAKLNYQFKSITANLSVLRASSQNQSGQFERSTAGYTKWDAELYYQFQFNPFQANRQNDKSSDAQVYLKVINIGDEEIRSSVSFLRDFAPEAGRSIELGLSVQLQ